MHRRSAGVVLLSIFMPFARAAHGVQPESSDATVKASKASAEMLRLSLKEAVGIALAPGGNVRVRLAAESIRQARARAGQSRAALLPRVEASIGEQNLTR